MSKTINLTCTVDSVGCSAVINEQLSLVLDVLQVQKVSIQLDSYTTVDKACGLF